MKCWHCGEEIVTARICPYCGARSEGEPRSGKDAKGPEGKFKGRIEESGAGPKSRVSLWATLLRYLFDPSVPAWRKYVPVAGLLYLLSPLDLLPDLFLGAGWLDDLAILAVIWQYGTRELRKYRERTRL